MNCFKEKIGDYTVNKNVLLINSYSHRVKLKYKKQRYSMSEDPNFYCTCCNYNAAI
jgi:hypothetical protein